MRKSRHRCGRGEILGVGRLSKARGLNEGEFGLLISDRWQRQGIGTELLKRLVQIGRAEKLERLTASVMADNHAMQHVCKKAGFEVKQEENSPDFIAQYVF